jgi:Flp pilus assembly pilin Flp
VKNASFWKDEQGQDMVEYALLLAFVCLTGAAMYVSMGTMTSSLWGIVNSRLAASNQSS